MFIFVLWHLVVAGNTICASDVVGPWQIIVAGITICASDVFVPWQIVVAGITIRAIGVVDFVTLSNV